MIGIIVKNSIPIPKEIRRDIHNLCFAITLASRYIEENIETKNILDSILITMFPIFTDSKAKVRPEKAPPSIAPIKNAISILAPATKPTMDFEIM